LEKIYLKKEFKFVEKEPKTKTNQNQMLKYIKSSFKDMKTFLV